MELSIIGGGRVRSHLTKTTRSAASTGDYRFITCIELIVEPLPKDAIYALVLIDAPTQDLPSLPAELTLRIRRSPRFGNFYSAQRRILRIGSCALNVVCPPVAV